jgi:hypothetical protein
MDRRVFSQESNDSRAVGSSPVVLLRSRLAPSCGINARRFYHNSFQPLEVANTTEGKTPAEQDGGYRNQSVRTIVHH